MGRGNRTGLEAGCLALALAMAAPCAALAADVEFSASVDHDKVGLEDTLVLTVTLGTSKEPSVKEGLKLPEAPDFGVLSRNQSEQTSFSTVKGVASVHRTRVTTMTLRPHGAGTFTIRPGKVVIDGRSYETRALRVTVVPGRLFAAAKATDPFAIPGDERGAERMLAGLVGDIRPGADTDLYLRALLDKPRARLGEQVTLAIFLFGRVDISAVDNLKSNRSPFGGQERGRLNS